MAANSKHWADVNIWLLRVIDSCTTVHQLITATKILRLYQDRYPSNEVGDVMWNVHEYLEIKIDTKWGQVNY